MIIAYYEKTTHILRGVINIPDLTSLGSYFGDEFDYCVLDAIPNVDPSNTYIVTVNCTVEKLDNTVQ